MGRAAGTGSPIFFHCPVWRRSWPNRPPREDHVITLTGREKPRRPSGAVGTRSTFVAREYRCSCGHVGWSTHMDLARMAGASRRDR